MLHSTNGFIKTTIIIDGKVFPMEYEAPSNLMPGTIRSFGNIYLQPDKDPMGFTFFTINNEITAFTPMNLKHEAMVDIVEAVTGHRFPVSANINFE